MMGQTGCGAIANIRLVFSRWPQFLVLFVVFGLCLPVVGGVYVLKLLGK